MLIDGSLFVEHVLAHATATAHTSEGTRHNKAPIIAGPVNAVVTAIAINVGGDGPDALATER